MIDITAWMDAYLQELSKVFGERVWFVGLQGSYARGEATDNSDIDTVVILDELSIGDIDAYNAMLDALPDRELTCGFISGRDELLSWDAADLFQFYYDTRPIKGSLDELLPLIDGVAINRAIKMGVCNIYHGCVHNMLHQKSQEALRALYKSASFVVQAIYFKQTGKYVGRQSDLLTVVEPDEKEIIETYMNLKIGKAVDFAKASQALFSWCKKRIK